jgi:hypothetical protein
VLRGGQPVWPPVIEDQRLCFRDTAEQAGEAPVAVSQLQFFEEARHSLVDHGDAVATGRLRQCAAKPGLADPIGAGDDQVTLVGDPSASEQALEQGLVEAAARAVIDIFWAGTHMAQPGRAHPSHEPLRFSACNFTVYEQAQPFSVTEIGGRILGLQFGKGLGHTVQPQGLQVMECQALCILSMEVISATDVGVHVIRDGFLERVAVE